MVGDLLTLSNLNSTISGYATQLHGLNTKIANMVKKVGIMSDADLAAMGYAPGDVVEIRKYFGSLGNMLLNANGAGVISDGVTVPTLIVENAKYVRFGA